MQIRNIKDIFKREGQKYITNVMNEFLGIQECCNNEKNEVLKLRTNRPFFFV